MIIRLAILVWMMATSLFGDGLADLKNTLEKLNNRQPIRAQVKALTSSVTTEDKKATQASGSMEVTVDHNSSGVRILWSQDDLDRVRDEAVKGLKNPNLPNPLRGLMNSFNATTMDSLLAHSDDLLRTLSVSQLLSETPEARNGQTLRKLKFKVNKPLTEANRKSMKSYVDELTLWIDENGLPVASEEKTELKGSRFFIGFETSSLIKRSFRRVGDRLIVSDFESSSSNAISVMGTNSSTSRFIVTVN